MKKHLLIIGAALGLSFSAYAAPVVNPGAGTITTPISEVTITFPDASTVELNPNFVDWQEQQGGLYGISLSLGAKVYFGYDDDYGNKTAFTVDCSGNIVTVNLFTPLSNPFSYEDYGSIACEEGAFLVDGSPSEDISIQWTFPGSTATIPEVEVTPTRGSNNLNLSRIILEWPGCEVSLYIPDEDISDYFQFGNSSTSGAIKKQNIKSVTTVSKNGGPGNDLLVIDVQNSEDNNNIFTTIGTYQLSIDSQAIEIIASDGSALNSEEQFTFFITGFELYPPSNSNTENTSLVLSEFPGLSIIGDNVNVVNLDGIKIYSGYVEAGNLTTVQKEQTAVGNAESSEATEVNGNSGQKINFQYAQGALYTGLYTIYLPTGSVTENGNNLTTADGEALNFYYFVINTTALPPLPEVSSNPSAGVVSNLSNQIYVRWGEGDLPDAGLTPSLDFYGNYLERLTDLGKQVKFTLPDGTVEYPLAGTQNSLEDSGDGITPILGSVLGVTLDYNSYTSPGKYTLNIPAGYVNVKVDRYNMVPCEEVNLEFYIEGLEMDNAELLNPVISASEMYWSVELTWNETVSLVDAANLEIPVSYNGESVGGLNASQINLVQSGADEPAVTLLAETGDSGDILYLLLSSSTAYKGEGTYTFELPANMVVNSQGAFNKAQTINIEVVDALAIGEINPLSGAEFVVGEPVIIIISYEGAEVVEQNYSEDAPLLVTDYADFDEEYTWANEEVLLIEDNMVIINLGSNLHPATYSLTFRPGQVLVDGVENEGILDYIFTVKTREPSGDETDDPSGINSIKAEIANGNVYTLQGVRVIGNHLAKGIYIVNGKKVVVK